MVDQQVEILRPETLIKEFKKIGVTHIITIPDSETNYLYELMDQQDWLDVMPVSREGEMVPTRAYLVPNDGEEYLIWGATARILTNLFAIIDRIEERELDVEGSKNLELFA